MWLVPGDLIPAIGYSAQSKTATEAAVYIDIILTIMQYFRVLLYQLAPAGGSRKAKRLLGLVPGATMELRESAHTVVFSKLSVIDMYRRRLRWGGSRRDLEDACAGNA